MTSPSTRSPSPVPTTSGSQAWALRRLGGIAAQRESAESPHAEAFYHQTLTLAAELGMRPLMAHCHRGLGLPSLKRDREEQARSELATAMLQDLHTFLQQPARQSMPS